MSKFKKLGSTRLANHLEIRQDGEGIVWAYWVTPTFAPRSTESPWTRHDSYGRGDDPDEAVQDLMGAIDEEIAELQKFRQELERWRECADCEGLISDDPFEELCDICSGRRRPEITEIEEVARGWTYSYDGDAQVFSKLETAMNFRNHDLIMVERYAKRAKEGNK